MIYPVIGLAGSPPGLAGRLPALRWSGGIADLQISLLWTRWLGGRAAGSFAVRVHRPRGVGRLADQFGSTAADVSRGAVFVPAPARRWWWPAAVAVGAGGGLPLSQFLPGISAAPAKIAGSAGTVAWGQAEG